MISEKAILYIGSNNNTKKLERKKIEKIVDSAIEGYSCFDSIGKWKGSKEKSIKIEIILENKTRQDIIELAKVLRVELRQDAILIEFTSADIEFIS